ncbi:hypothetical protein CNEO4_240026 [Clostridium neonatale]|uniref:Uncharacterized protein n=1 Tax=Clostridium neonatale TaxID=137838 RepID=A0AA86JIP9_9CLOT|nr:hypothetical protein CNEO_43449 [Clostridium neonatale]CAI3569713.1 hypothetical protein CNEO4_170013 [Clostridium neonatale]CAI3618009.1 hypothetical protein CNEO4_240036 [Clostridium neonatale]CAI3621979.1 hypothetical protein CNEO4_240026 [Clostridium neonatale]CAI3642130.1 hypothetical protein CNEO3_340038 [Clostridium neonatale]
MNLITTQNQSQFNVIVYCHYLRSIYTIFTGLYKYLYFDLTLPCRLNKSHYKINLI